MWDRRNSLYAAPADCQEEIPLTRGSRTRWQRFKLWVRERPVASALIALLVVGGLIAVIVGPVVSSQRKDKDKGDGKLIQGIDFKMTFQAQDARQLFSNFSDSNFLSGYASKLQNSIASILDVQPSQIAIQSVQCDAKTFYLGSTGGRRLLQDTSADAGSGGISIVVIFRVLPLADSGGSSGAGGATSKMLPAPDAAALQLQSSSLLLQQTVSEALGLPSNNVLLISVVTTQQGSAASPPLPPIPSGPPPAPSPPPVESSPDPLQSSSPPPAAVPGIYSPPPLQQGVWYLPPAYGGRDAAASGLPPPYQPPPVYGSDGNSRRR